MKLLKITSVFILLVLVSCKDSHKDSITQKEDYNAFLNPSSNSHLDQTMSDISFWKTKLANTPNQYPYNAKLAANYNTIFSITGDINQLKEAEQNLVIANEKVNYTHCGYLRSLARNYISQHRFNEALVLLDKAASIGENLKATQLMLVDVHLELGNYAKVTSYLSKVKNTNDFNYLIRVSKYNDHKGNLEAAISYLEQSLTIAKANGNKALLQWNYTNLADYYGHAGRIQDSYQSYLKALSIDPNDAYAKKGIAWIVYSYERNPEEALRILATVVQQNASPDYYLLKAEIAEYMNNQALKEENLASYFAAIDNPKYGVMYNSYNVELYANNHTTTQKAIRIAQTEVAQRPTPQSYDLLAWAYYKNGEIKKALAIVNEHVINHTFEPVALLHAAYIFKANGNTKEMLPLKKELFGSVYELGPLAENSIHEIYAL